MLELKSSQYSILFVIGGMLYALIEILYKGNTHISMVIAGGIAFVLIGLLSEGNHNPSLLSQMIVSAFIITIIEFVTGVIVNICLHENVWNYSRLPYNYKGQICLLFSCIWFLLSLPAIYLNDVIRHVFFRQKRRKYHVM